MNIGAALVLFAVIWFMVLFVVLPIGLRSQQDDGDVVPGTPASSPVNPNIGKKAKWTTIIAILIWLPTAYVIKSGLITVDMLVYLPGIDNAY